MSYYDVGALWVDPKSYNTLNVTSSQPTDIFAFSILFSWPRKVFLDLHDISANDDANLSVYQDINGNGIWDGGDPLITFSAESGNADDVINFEATLGDYFAIVNRYEATFKRLISHLRA